MSNTQSIMSILFLLIFYTQTALAYTSKEPPNGLYGKDERKEAYEIISDRNLNELSRSTVTLIHDKKLVKHPDFEDSQYLKGRLFGETDNYCEETRFLDQVSGSFCSGFLVSQNTVITAGHCVAKDGLNAADPTKYEASCKGILFVFDYRYSDKNKNIRRVLKRNIFKCKRIASASLRPDYAIIELERPVTNRTPMRLRKDGEIEAFEDHFFTIGHPKGLPQKITKSVQAWDVNNDYFLAPLNIYGGNSGGPVINNKTFEVEGIISQGIFVSHYLPIGPNSCHKTIHCKAEPSNNYVFRGNQIINSKVIPKTWQSKN